MEKYYTYYVVMPGDTLYSIGKRFGVNTKLIAMLNGIKEEEYIYPNQNLIIPRKGIQYYITKDNDTLKSVANVFNISEEFLMKDNKSIYLLPGQLIFYKE